MKYACFTAMFIVLCAAGSAQTIYVGPGPDDYPTIQSALESYVPYDTILVKPGTYNENLDFTYMSSWGATLKSTDGPEVTIIRGNLSGSVLWVQDVSITIDGFTITNGSASMGGGIMIHLADSSTVIKNNIIVGNHSEYGGGGIHIDMEASPLIFNNLIYDNTSNAHGGGVSVEYLSDVILRNNTVVDNSPYDVYCDESSLVLENTILHSYSTDNNGTITTDHSFVGGDPLFVTGPKGDYYLSQVDAGQTSTSPCVDAGSGTAASLGLDTKTTRTDEVGDTGTVDMGFHRDIHVETPDTEPPSVTITEPLDGAVFGTTEITVTADVVDESEIDSVVSTPAGIDESSLPAGGVTVTGTVPLLSEGLNTITVSATDTAGNTGGASVMVMRDTLPPEVTVTSPPEGAVVGDNPVNMSVDVNDATAMEVTIGSEVFSLDSGSHTVNTSLTLVEGENAVTVKVVDEVGNETLVIHHLTLDLTAPIVTIDAPANNALFGPGDETIAVTATVSDLSATEAVFSPQNVPDPPYDLPAGGGIASGTVDLAEGPNTVIVTATDETSREGAASITVTLDTVSPDVEITSPEDQDAVSGTIEFEAAADDPEPGTGVARVDLLMDGAVIASPTETPYGIDYDTTLADDGWHTFTAAAYDGVGNSAQHSVSVLVDNTVPGITILNPLPGAVVSDQIQVQADVTDAGAGIAAIAIGTNDPTNYDPPQAALSLNEPYDTTVFPDGNHTITVTAWDAAGNESTATVEVVIENAPEPPEVAIDYPGEGDKVSGSIDITASATNFDELQIFVDGALQGTSTATPFTVTYDTLGHLDGEMIIEARALTAQGSVSRQITVIVDNMESFRLRPRFLLLFRGKVWCPPFLPMWAFIKGPNAADLLLPFDQHTVELRVPGASPVPALDGGEFGSWVRFRFQRRALLNAIRAGIDAGVIPAPYRKHPVRVEVELVVDGSVIETRRIRVRDPFKFNP